DDSLHRVGDPVARLHRHRARHRARARGGASSGGGGHQRRHREPRHGVQLDADRALDLDRADVPRASASGSAGAAGARRAVVCRPQPHPAHAGPHRLIEASRMSALAIEINDSGLVVANAEGVLAVEPGYALAERGNIVTGSEAYRQARLKPRQVSNRYWSELSLEPGSSGIDGVGNAAELAYAQLSDIWRRLGSEDPVVFVVPGYYSREQLGLLVGLAEEAGVTVAALVDAAAAASMRPYPARQLVYVDAGLHRV